MNSEMKKVKAFMEKMKQDCGQILGFYPSSTVLSHVNRQLGLLSIQLEAAAMGYPSDHRVHHVWLIAEELHEIIDAMIEQDEVALLDGLADLVYVTLSAAARFDLPLSEAFNEVHKSNMTKVSDPNDKIAQKDSPDFKPPNIAKVLRKYRK